MNILGLIAEYNPFHFGHKYHLEQSLKETNCDHSIAIMSGSFVQRGMPSFVDKWSKAKMAIDNGVDLVIELPTIYSSQSAELFSLGAIKILNAINVVDYLSFGSEEGNLEPLKEISYILLDESIEFKKHLNYYLSLGNSFPVSRSLALQDYINQNSLFKVDNVQDILKESNNILAIEYLKALHSINSDIKPYTIKRIGSDYKDKSIKTKYSSATGIRNIILNNNIDASKELLPKESFNILREYIEKYKQFNTIKNHNNIIRYLFLTTDKNKLKNLIDINEGLENRIINFFKKDQDIENIISQISTKRYPSTRIQRIFIHLLLGLNQIDIENAYLNNPQHIRVLGSNKKGHSIINKIKKESPIKVITKFSDYKKYNIKEISKILEFEKKATDIYFLGLDSIKNSTDKDYYISPYIK